MTSRNHDKTVYASTIKVKVIASLFFVAFFIFIVLGNVLQGSWKLFSDFQAAGNLSNQLATNVIPLTENNSTFSSI